MIQIVIEQGEWLRQGLTYDIGEYIVGEFVFRLQLNVRFFSIALITARNCLYCFR